MMEYKGYFGKVEFDDEAKILHGQVIGLRDIITFQAQDIAGIMKAFRDSVDDYLAFCEQEGKEPDKSYSGSFILRVPPKLHRSLDVAAQVSGKSVNALATDILRKCLEETPVELDGLRETLGQLNRKHGRTLKRLASE